MNKLEVLGMIHSPVGITISIVNRSGKDDVHMRIETKYHGYPSNFYEYWLVSCLGKEWLNEFGLMILSASDKLKDNQYNQQDSQP